MAGSDEFDVLVIGAGPGGYVAAIRAAQKGLKTACVDRRETLGGTCLNVGCIPSKSLLHASEIYEQAVSGAFAAHGLSFGEVGYALDNVHRHKDETVSELTRGIAYLFKKNGVTRIAGEARFVGADRVEVDGDVYRAKNIIIATGAEPMDLPGVAFDHERILDSTSALSIPQTPESLVVIGGGVIGLELGTVWRRFGAEVTVIEASDSLLPQMDADLRKEAAQLFSKQGMRLKLNAKVLSCKRTDKGVSLAVETREGGEETVEASHVLAAIGRRAHTAGLDLDTAGVKADQRGLIFVDEGFRTSQPGVYAIGDVIKGPMLAHRAEDEGIAVADNIAGGDGVVNHEVIPSVVYTRPEIASVGLTQEEAEARGPVRVGKFPFAANSRAKTMSETSGFVKVVCCEQTDRVLGVHIIGELAGSMIAQAAQLMEFGGSSEDIAYACHAHPTHAEALKEAAMAVRSAPIHI